MVERKVCTFCGDEIEPGTGRMYIKKDGIVYNFCSSKCFKNMIVLGRVPRRTTWTRYYAREKEVRVKGQPKDEGKPKARKLKKPATKERQAEKPAQEPTGEEERKPAPQGAQQKDTEKDQVRARAENQRPAKGASEAAREGA